jgi:putative nucleotidyltransferase with HDIG domain
VEVDEDGDRTPVALDSALGIDLAHPLHGVTWRAPTGGDVVTEEEIQQFRSDVIAQKNLPTIPVVLAKVLQLCSNDGADSRQLITVIEEDQALTGKMLRLANSAFFGQSRRVETISRAVVLLGFSTVRNLALSVKVWDALAAGIARAQLEVLWDHSLACAVAAKELVARLRAGDPDRAFTAGLLHDVGRLILAMRLRDEYWKVVGGVGESESIDAVERSAFGVDHAEAGAWMLEAWALPTAIVESVRLHHDVSGVPVESRIVGVADRLLGATELVSGEVGPRGSELLEQTSTHGLTLEVWQAVVARLGAGEHATAFGLASSEQGGREGQRRSRAA